MREISCCGLGSSPRMRGKLKTLNDAGYKSRLIPAHAGKTRNPAHRPPLNRAHPRACGENGRDVRQERSQAGSSPRMRGKRRKQRDRSQSEGLIPAHAGKTSSRAPRRWKSRAHPRACGENTKRLFFVAMVRGSSPRMRGKRKSVLAEIIQRGLIPAHAGKTPFHGSGRGSVGAHPRACGENNTVRSYLRKKLGSSPRMRGKRRSSRSPYPCRRLIPAHAGKT